MSWDNPYTDVNRKAHTAQLNRERVLRQKKEREFMRGLHARYSMDRMDEVEQQLEEANKIKLLEVRQAQRQRSRTPQVAAERPAITTVSRLDAQLRCFFATHGGATLWTGEADGCIGIRNGLDGSLAYRIAKTDGLFVDTIFQSSAQHMWVGMSDGTIRIYDPIVFILLFEGKKHTKAITAFAETFDGKVFSASVDGTIIKWDSEAHEFECMLEIPAVGDAAVRSLACYGYHVFVASDSPTVRCLDAETGLDTRVYDGHEGVVTCVAVVDGYLWTGSADATVAVWTMEDPERVATLELHRCGVTGLFADDIGHTVWSADETGVVHVWHSSPERNFAHVRSYTPDGSGDKAVRSIKGFVAVDASKLWSLGGNGANFVWHSATNRVERATKQAVLTMEHIIDQDAKELDRWAAVLANLKDVAARLRGTMARELGAGAERTIRQEYLFTWLRHAQRRLWRRRLPIASQGLSNAAADDLRGRYLATWGRFLKERQRRRHLEIVAATFARNHKHERVIEAYGRAQAFYRLMRARIAAQQRAAVLHEGQSRRRLSAAYRAWVDAHATAKRAAKRRQMAEALAVVTQRCTVQSFFSTWAGCTRRKQLARKAVARSMALGAAADRSLMARMYFRWASNRPRRRLDTRRTKLVAIAARRASRVLASAAYWKWLRWLQDRQLARGAERLRAVRAETAALQSKLDAVEHITARQKLVDEVQRLIDQTNENIAAKKARLAAIDDECGVIAQETELKRSGHAREVERSITEQVDDLIAMLKAKVINVHQDYALAHKVLIKANSVPATSLFLEAHQAVKRIVVDLTGKSMLSAEDVWPLSETRIKTMPKHHAESVLTAIKTMIVTFDILTPEARHSLQTDNEIAINAHWLVAFADNCIAMRKRALGKAMYRVK